MVINEQSIKCNCMRNKIVKDVSDWPHDHLWRFKVHSSKLQIVNTHTMHLWSRNYLPSVAPEFSQVFLVAFVLLELFSVGHCIVCPCPLPMFLTRLPFCSRLVIVLSALVLCRCTSPGYLWSLKLFLIR